MTLKEFYKKNIIKLELAGVPSPAFDSFMLISHILKIEKSEFIINPNKKINSEDEIKINDLIERRVSREPLQYILGMWEFCGLPFYVGKGVLVPRDDTEVVVNSAKVFLNKRIAEEPRHSAFSHKTSVSTPQEKSSEMGHNFVDNEIKIVDLCSGSGAIAIALKHFFPKATVVAVEKSLKAFDFLQKNIELNESEIIALNNDIATCHKSFRNNEFDLIISNPPYITKNELKALQKEVQKEPSIALDGGTDGYDFYKIIIDNWTPKLKKGGMLAMELGENQYDFVAKLMKNVGYKKIEYSLDLQNIKRAITGFLF